VRAKAAGYEPVLHIYAACRHHRQLYADTRARRRAAIGWPLLASWRRSQSRSTGARQQKHQQQIRSSVKVTHTSSGVWQAAVARFKPPHHGLVTQITLGVLSPLRRCHSQQMQTPCQPQRHLIAQVLSPAALSASSRVGRPALRSVRSVCGVCCRHAPVDSPPACGEPHKVASQQQGPVTHRPQRHHAHGARVTDAHASHSTRQTHAAAAARP
jgi:hypothetical protein